MFGFFALWLRLAVEAPRALLTRNWRWGALLGVIFAGATAAIAFNPTSCSRPPAARSSSASATRNLERPAARVGAVLESADSHSGRSGRDHLFSFALGPRRARRQ